MNKKTYETASFKKIDGSKVEIIGSIGVETWSNYRSQAIKNINNSITIDGFRKGLIPENILISKVGEMAVLEEMAEIALSHAYLNIITDNKIDAIGKPEVHITKIAKDNPLEFRIVTAIMPEITLPNYKEISAKAIKEAGSPQEEVNNKEIDDAILEIRKSRVSHENHDHDKLTKEEHEKMIMDNLPELTDDFVKTLGDFSDIPDFKNKLSKMIIEDKKRVHKEKIRIKIADKIAEESKISLPDIMIDTEIDRTEAQFKSDIERMGIKVDDYLKHAKKTIEDLRKDWKPQAEKKAKLQLILNSISIKENIKPSKEEVDNEVNHILEHYKDADRERATVYAETVLTNEKVFEFLEE